MRMTVRSENGAAAVVVAVALPVLFGMAMLSVDAGAVWAARRDITTATDAAALAGARDEALGGDGCANAAPDLLASNTTDATLTSCAPAVAGNGGSVTVVARSGDVPVRFGRVLGIGDQHVGSASSAQWGALRAAERLRPIGICVEDPHVRWWLGRGPDTGVHPAPGVHRLSFTKDSPHACGANAPGNWGWIDLDGASNSNADTMTWVEHGYPGRVGVRDCDGDGHEGDPCEGDTGSSGGSVTSSLQELVDSGEEFGIVLYDRVIGGGANVRYDVYGFVGLVLHGYRVTGAEHQRYFDVGFRRIVLHGICCDQSAPDTGVYGVGMCAVDEIDGRACTASMDTEGGADE